MLAGFTTQPPAGSERAPEAVAPEGGFDAVVAFVGKFADWKRLDALLRAAASYERGERRVLTLVAGSGPVEEQVKMHDLAASLGLERTYFLGPRQQEELATLFACADVGVFPSYREPFGLVFLECMACETPVIGADSGGPRDFVTDEVGTLVPETDDRQELADSLAAAVTRALDEGWKQGKGPDAARYARERFSVVKQVSDLLGEVDRLTGDSDPGDPVDQARGRDHRREPRDARDAGERAPQQHVEGLDVGDVDAQQVVDVAGDVVAAHEPVEVDDVALEAADGVGGVVDERRRQVHDQPAVDGVGVEHRAVAAHHLLALEAPQPALGRRRGDRHGLREVGEALPSVVGEVVEDAAIDAVQGRLGGSCTVWRRHDAIMRLRRRRPGRSPGITRGRARIVEA